MPTNQGLLKEDEIIQRLNNKKIKELSNNLKDLLRSLYGVIEERKIVRCEKIDDYIKPDFFIEYDGKRKYISMKTGRATTVHQETIKSFILFLRELGISTRTQQTILLYQYGDGTLDGSGKQRYDYNKLRLLLSERIEEANYELNSNKTIIQKVFERCVCVGTKENAIPIDCIYFGTFEYGVVATRRQLDKYISLKNWNWMNNLHIGPLQLRPHARYINKPIKSEKKRNEIEIYWANFGSDIDYISSRYDY